MASLPGYILITDDMPECRLNVQRMKKVKPYRSLRASRMKEDLHLRPLETRNRQELYNSDTGEENRDDNDSCRSTGDLDQTRDHSEERSPQSWKENSACASVILGSTSLNKTKRQQKLRSQKRKTSQQSPLTEIAAYHTNPFQRTHLIEPPVSRPRSELERSREYYQKRSPWTLKEKSPLKVNSSPSSTILGSLTSYKKKRQLKQPTHQGEKLEQAPSTESIAPPVSQFQSARTSGSPGLGFGQNSLKLRPMEEAILWRSVVAPDYDGLSDSNLDYTTGSEDDYDRLNAQPVNKVIESVTLQISETPGSLGKSAQEVCSDDDFQIKTKKKGDINRSSLGCFNNQSEESQRQNQRGGSSILFGASSTSYSRYQPQTVKKPKRLQSGSASSTKSASSGRKRFKRARIVETPKPRLDIQVVKHKTKTPPSTSRYRFYTPLEEMSSCSS